MSLYSRKTEANKEIQAPKKSQSNTASTSCGLFGREIAEVICPRVQGGSK